MEEDRLRKVELALVGKEQADAMGEASEASARRSKQTAHGASDEDEEDEEDEDEEDRPKPKKQKKVKALSKQKGKESAKTKPGKVVADSAMGDDIIEPIEWSDSD